MKRVLVDTGPLVAIFSAADEHHESCVEALQSLPSPLLSCWPVITEAVWLLRANSQGVQQLLRSIQAGFVELLPLTSSETAHIADLMRKSENMRLQLADAALIYLAEREGIDSIFTLDRRDFSVYRLSGKRSFRIIP